MGQINGVEVGKIVVMIGGVEMGQAKSIEYTESDNSDLQMTYKLKPLRLIYPPPPKIRFEPSIIEVIALGKHNNN